MISANKSFKATKFRRSKPARGYVSMNEGIPNLMGVHAHKLYR